MLYWDISPSHAAGCALGLADTVLRWRPLWLSNDVCPKFRDTATQSVATTQEDQLLSAFSSALRTPDLRKKLLFTVAIVAIYRLGATLPSPGVSYANVQALATLIPGCLVPDLIAILGSMFFVVGDIDK